MLLGRSGFTDRQVKILFLNYLPQLIALESSGNNCHVVGEIRFYRQTYTLTDVVN